jgi:hypothetical protein
LQLTSPKTIAELNGKNLEGVYRVPVPRDELYAGARLRGTYLIMNMTNTDVSLEFPLHKIVTMYRPSRKSI